MNWLSSLIEKLFINGSRVLIFAACFFGQVTVKAWEVDMSRREKDLNKLDKQGPAPLDFSSKADTKGILGTVFQSLEPTQEVVILNTEKGFVPETVRLKKDRNYKVHIVNVNEKEKNTSFILDAFSEHHGTFFGQPKSFDVSPKVEGIFSFQCPETAKQGRIVVAPDVDVRKPAGE